MAVTLREASVAPCRGPLGDALAPSPSKARSRIGTRVRPKGHRIDVTAAAFQGALFNVTRTFALTPTVKAEAVLAELVDVFVLGLERRPGIDPAAMRR